LSVGQLQNKFVRLLLIPNAHGSDFVEQIPLYNIYPGIQDAQMLGEYYEIQ